MRGLTLWVALHVVAAIAGSSQRAAAPVPAGFSGWPAELEGRPLTALPLTVREVELARGFPGRVGRFTDGASEIVLRWVAAPTRQLHPVADCLRATGWTVEPGPLRVDAHGRSWGTARARRGGLKLEVAERIAGADGSTFPDASSWYWATLTGRTRGPWWAVTDAYCVK